MIKAALEWLAEQARPETVTVGGVDYATRPVHDPRKPEPKAEPLVFRTLAGFAGYLLAAERFEAAVALPEGPEDAIVHVVSPTHVRAVGPARERWHDREVVAEARIERWWASHDQRRSSLPSAIVELRSCFAESVDRDKLVAALGNVQGGTELRAEDDGFSQQVSVRTGVRAAWETLPNPASLRPHRTFPEVEQPASPYLVRLDGGGEKAPIEVALHLADGGAWELEAVASIGDYLRGVLGEVWTVLV